MTRDKGPRDDRWYLNIMAPNTKGAKFAWLDPTSIYINAAAFGDLLDDLCAELDPAAIDVVGGLDAMGFVLGAALGARLGRGFLPSAVSTITDLKNQVTRLQGLITHGKPTPPAPPKGADSDPKLAFYEKLSGKKEDVKKKLLLFILKDCLTK